MSEHNRPDCDGAFRSMYNDTAALESGPSALVCPGCGAHRLIERMDPADRPADDPEAAA